MKRLSFQGIEFRAKIDEHIIFPLCKTISMRGIDTIRRELDIYYSNWEQATIYTEQAGFPSFIIYSDRVKLIMESGHRDSPIVVATKAIREQEKAMNELTKLATYKPKYDPKLFKGTWDVIDEHNLSDKEKREQARKNKHKNKYKKRRKIVPLLRLFNN